MLFKVPICLLGILMIIPIINMSLTCDLEFVKVTVHTDVLNTCHFANLQRTSMFPVGQILTVDRHHLATKSELGTTEYSCTKTGWSPDWQPAVCAQMTEAVLLIGSFGLALYIPNKSSVQLDLPFEGGHMGHVSAALHDGTAIVVGGYDNREYLSKTWKINVNTWQVLPREGTNWVRYHSSAAVLNGTLYVCTGYTNQVYVDHIRRTCEKYVGSEWQMMEAKLLDDRLGSEMVAVRSSLYIIGGYQLEMSVAANTVDKYSLLTGKWHIAAPMQEHRQFFAAAVLDGVIFACGGAVKLFEWGLASCEQYVDCDGEQLCDYVDEKIWKYVAAMEENRQYFAMVAFQGRLYSFGGLTWWEDTHTFPSGHVSTSTKVRTLNSIESFDPDTNRWKLEELELPRPMEKHSAVVISVLEGLQDLH